MPYLSAPIRVGIAGLGTAGLAFIPAIKADPRFVLAALAEPDEEIRVRLAQLHGVAGVAGIEALAADPALDAVIIATPTPLHMPHASLALEAGKHVILEKPMATNLDDALAMAALAKCQDLVLIIGHSHSFDLPVKRMREIIAGGRFGRARMINSWNFTDWVYRPRRPDELDWAQGGGVTLRQGSHQFDIIRLLGGGALKTVRAQIFDWDAARPVIGAHSAFFEFSGGLTATAVYSGYGGLPGSELISGVSEWGYPDNAPSPSARLAPANVAQAKRRVAGASDKSNPAYQAHFGLTVVNCEGGDIRQSPDGLLLYSPAGREEIALDPMMTPHRLVIEEFADAVLGVTPALHDGAWGVANLETCLAVIEAGRSGETVGLRHQVDLGEMLA